MRQKDIDSSIFSDLIIGIVTLLNCQTINQEDYNELNIRPTTLFRDLCKYLSLIANKEDAILLINKAIEASALRVDTFDIKSKHFFTFPVFTVPSKSEVGSVIIGTTGFAEGQSNIAAGFSSHSEGRGCISACKYAHTEGRKTFAGYAAQTAGNPIFQCQGL